MSEASYDFRPDMESLEIKDGVKRVVTNCAMKREMLLHDALSRSKQKKRLTFISGLLALFSAGTITTVIVKFFDNEVLQIIAAFTAATSGFISLMTSVYYVEEETSKIFLGSSKYLALRDKAYRLLIQPNTTNEQIFKELENLLVEYAQLDESYSKYLKIEYMSPTDPFQQLRGLGRIERQKVEKAYYGELKNFDKKVGSMRNNNKL